MSDFEARLKQLLNEQVDHELDGRRRNPPVLDRSRDGSRRARPVWLLPVLAAAAVVVAAATGGVVAHSVAGGERSVSPATDAAEPTAAPSGSTTASTPASVPSTTRAPSGGTASVSSPVAPPKTASRTQPRTPPSTRTVDEPLATPSGTTVVLDRATIALPTGWVAREQNGPSGVNAWCLGVRGRSEDTCAVALLHVDSLPEGAGLDREGVLGDPPQYLCGQAALTPTVKASKATFGGRPARVREFDRVCASSGQRFRTLQYVVAEAPTWALTVIGATSRDRDVARRIVTDSRLPR